MRNQCVFIFIILSFITYGVCEVVKFFECDNTDATGLCIINEVRIHPCKEAVSNKACEFKRGNPAGIEIDFHALKSMEALNGQVYGSILGTDVRFVDIDSDACKFTKCPIEQGVNQTYAFNLGVRKSYPRGTFDVKLKMTSGTDGCCCQFRLKLV